MPEDYHDEDQTQSFVPLTKGTEIGHYKILSKIGAGGMGEVYLAEDMKLNRQVALKFMPRHMAGDSDMRARFTREAQAAAKLDHPNIVPIHEVGEYQGRPYFAMAHIEGQSLREVIKEGKLGTDEAIGLTMQILEGLHKAHESGVVHRDIKPGNIIIDNDGRARLVDFGLAMVSGEDKLTKTGSTLGTVGYMSPEQVEGKKCDHRSDLFSVGVILYEMLTGRKPFEGDNDAAIARAITDASPEPVARYKSGVTGEIQQIIDKALTKDPFLRYQHADGMLSDLKRVQFGTVSARRSRAGVWVIAALVFIAAVFLGYFQYFGSNKDGEVAFKRVLVLPFENQGEAEKAYFAAGITDEIMSRLTNISGMAVLSRGSASKYIAAGLSSKEIGDTLGAEYVLDGTIRWQETSSGINRIRITTHLMRVDENISLWSKVYDTVLTEVFSVQSDIAENVGEQMGIVLLESEKGEIQQHQTVNEQAYDFYLRGQRYGWRRSGYESKKDILLGIEMLQKAVALDSSFASAYSRMSQLYSRLRARGYDWSDSCCQMAKDLADRAFELGTGAWEKYRAMGDYHYRCERDHENALYYYDLAYKGNRNAVGYLYAAHNVLRRMGRFEEAYNNIRRVIELNPRSTVAKYDLSDDCIILKRFAEAEGLLDTVITLEPDFFRAYTKMVMLYLNWQGDVDKARQVIARSRGKVDSTYWHTYMQWLDMKEGRFQESFDAITMPPYDSTYYYFGRAFMFRRMGNPTRMRAYADSCVVHLEREVKNDPDDSDYRGDLGRVYAILERSEEALKEGLKAIELSPISEDAVVGYHPLMAMFDICLFLGDMDRAIEQLDTLLSTPGDMGIAHIFVDPDYRPILSHPRFPELVKKHADPDMVATLLGRL